MLDDKDLPESTLRRILWEALAKYPTHELLQLILDEDPIVRTSAAKQLHLRGSQELLQHLLPLLNDPRAVVREIAAFGLGQLGTPEKPFKAASNAPLTLRLVSDDSADVRSAAAAALGHLFVDEDLPAPTEQALIAAASDPAANVRASVAFALRSHTGERVLEVLDRLARDADPSVRFWASDEQSQT